MDDNPGEKGRLPIDQFMDELDTSVLDADEKLSVTDEKLAGHRVLDTFSGSEETEDEVKYSQLSRSTGMDVSATFALSCSFASYMGFRVVVHQLPKMWGSFPV